MYFTVSDKQIDDARALWRRLSDAERIQPIFSAQNERLYRIAARAWERYKRLCSKQHFQAATAIKSIKLEQNP